MRYDVHISGDDLREMVARLELGHWDEAEDALIAAYGEAFAGTSALIEDIQAIALEFGTGAAPDIPFIEQFPPTLGRSRGAAR
jgi:hypothetical protein